MAAPCPNCGREPPADAAFCPSCGTPLTAAAPEREERKLISVLFVDLVGSTAQADQADPEDVKDTLQAFHSRTKQEIERFGGTVEKFIGDAVMAVFGAPVAHGDDAERAVRAGLRVVDAIEELDRELPDVTMQVRAAVNTGDAVVAVGSRPETGDALAMGDVVNTASRLQNSAPVGGLIVGEETYRATRTMIRYQELDPIQAKGKREPVAAWLAIAPVGAPAERPATTAPLVGRARELALLDSVWDRAAAERRPYLVTLVGPTGIGKSRMAAEIRARAEAAGARTFVGRCLPYGQTSYRPFTEQVRAAAGIFESDDPDEASRKLRERIAGLDASPEAEEIARLVGALLGLGASDAPPEEPLQLFFGARRIVELLASEQPTVFVFEDIHWADPPQLDLLEYLAMHVHDVPALFLALARSELLEVRPGWGSGILSHTAIPLEPLSPIDAASIASYLLSGGGDLSSVERLVEVAEGNPCSSRSSRPRSSIAVRPTSSRPRSGRRSRRGSTRSPPSPGPRSWPPRWSARTSGGASSDRSTTSRVWTRRSWRSSRGTCPARTVSQVKGDAEFSFKHILIREVAYSTLARADRRRRHADVARFIEGAVAGQTGTSHGSRPPLARGGELERYCPT